MAASTGLAGLVRLSNAAFIHTRASISCVHSPFVTYSSLLVLQNGGGNKIISRSAGFFTRLTADDLWRGVTGVSNAGRQRGRGKRAMKRVDLNRGQQLGQGPTNMVWPGLNAPVIKGKELIRMKQLPPDPQRMEKLLEARGTRSFRQFKLTPLERGWTGTRYPGMSIGPPDRIADYDFEGFDTRVLEFKMVANMTDNKGRKRRFSAFVVTGNKKGLAGYGLAKSPNMRAALRKAKNIAGQRLQYVDRYQDHTIYHNFYSKHQSTALMVKKVGQGHGLVCHRALKTICEVIGIEDIYAKIEGSKGNIQNLTKAFFEGLQRQETHQELADRMKLHLVELRPERNYFPQVVASPQGEVSETGVKEEVTDFESLYFKGRVPFVRKRPPPFWQRQKNWYAKWGQMHRLRNQHAAQRERIVLGIEPSSEEKAFRLKPLKGSRD